MMKKIGMFILLFFFLFPVVVEATPNIYGRDKDNLQIWDSIEVTEDNIEDILTTFKVDETKKVYDFAELFTEEEEQKMLEEITSYIELYHMDMVIVTIRENNKKSTEAYVQDFYDYNYFGKNDTYDGIIYGIDMDKRTITLQTIGKAQLFYDDERINKILDNAYESVLMEKYALSGNSFIKDAKKYAQSGIPSSNHDYTINQNGDMVKIKKVNWTLTILGSLLIPSLTVFIFISKHKGIHLKTEANDYLDKSKVEYSPAVDVFVSTHTTRVPIPKSTSSSSSRVGGSSISRGSSGRSHGGGSRHF